MFVYMMIPASLDVTLEHYGEFSNGETVLSNHRSLCETEASCQRIQNMARTRLTNGKAYDLVLKRRRFKFLRSMRPSIACTLFLPIIVTRTAQHYQVPTHTFNTRKALFPFLPSCFAFIFHVRAVLQNCMQPMFTLTHHRR